MAAQQAKPACKTCVFWKMLRGPDHGECHRYPPMVDGWPYSDAQQWCGEWKAKPDPGSPVALTPPDSGSMPA